MYMILCWSVAITSVPLMEFRVDVSGQRWADRRVCEGHPGAGVDSHCIFGKQIHLCKGHHLFVTSPHPYVFPPTATLPSSIVLKVVLFSLYLTWSPTQWWRPENVTEVQTRGGKRTIADRTEGGKEKWQRGKHIYWHPWAVSALINGGWNSCLAKRCCWGVEKTQPLT